MPYHRDWSTEIITEIASWFTAHSTWTWCVVEAEFVQKFVCISQTSGRIWSLLLQYSYKWFSQGWEIPVSIERPEKPGRRSCFSAQQTSWCASSPLQHCQAVLPPPPPGTQYSSLLTSIYKRQFPLPPPRYSHLCSSHSSLWLCSHSSVPHRPCAPVSCAISTFTICFHSPPSLLLTRSPILPRSDPAQHCTERNILFHCKAYLWRQSLESLIPSISSRGSAN